MKKRILALFLLLALAALPASAQTADPDEVLNVAINCAKLVSGADDGAWMETSSANIVLLDFLNAWYLTIYEQYVLLETPEITYVFAVCREDPGEMLQLALSAKHGMQDYQEIMVLVEHPFLGEFLVTDENFAEYVEAVESSGYEDVEESRLASDIPFAIKYDLDAPQQYSGSFYNDSFGVDFGVSSDSFLNEALDITVYPWEVDSLAGSAEAAGISGEDYCGVCYNTGTCQTCYGDGTWRNPYTGNMIECSSCTNGSCPYC